MSWQPVGTRFGHNSSRRHSERREGAKKNSTTGMRILKTKTEKVGERKGRRKEHSEGAASRRKFFYSATRLSTSNAELQAARSANKASNIGGRAEMGKGSGRRENEKSGSREMMSRAREQEVLNIVKVIELQSMQLGEGSSLMRWRLLL